MWCSVVSQFKEQYIRNTYARNSEQAIRHTKVLFMVVNIMTSVINGMEKLFMTI